MLQRTSLLTLLAILALVHGLLLLPLPFALQALDILLLSGFIPGLLWVEVLVGRSTAPPTIAEYLLYAIGIGYSNLVILMLLVHNLPGPVAFWQTLLAFDGVTGLLWLWLFWQPSTAQAWVEEEISLTAPTRLARKEK
jgi:hypothetical protein